MMCYAGWSDAAAGLAVLLGLTFSLRLGCRCGGSGTAAAAAVLAVAGPPKTLGLVAAAPDCPGL